jgi:hypothetical protein
MGVDFYSCSNCRETFPDCGYYFTCSQCEHMFCSNDCGGREYVKDENGEHKTSRYGEELTSCILCRKEDATSDQLLHFLLAKFGLTRDQAMEMYKKEG